MLSADTSSKLNKVMAAEVLYYAAYFLYCLNYMIRQTTFKEFLFIPVATLTSIVHAAVLILLFIKFVSQRAAFSGWVVAAVIVLVGFVGWRQSGEGWLFWLALFVVCSGRVRLMPLAKIAFAVMAVMFVLTVSFSYAGVIQERVLSRSGGITRHSLGFNHPNYIGKQLLVICLAFSVLRFGKNPLPDILLIIVADIFNITFADSRTAVVLSFVQILLLLVSNRTKEEKRRSKILICCVVTLILMVCASFYSMVNYDPSSSLYQLLNSAFSSRLSLQHGYYSMQGLTLFGSTFEGFSPIAWSPISGAPITFLVDNAWCHLLLRYGIVPTFVFLAGLALLLRKLLVEKRWDALTFGLILTLAYGVMETSGIQFECNYFLFALGAELLYGSSSVLRGEATKQSFNSQLSA